MMAGGQFVCLCFTFQGLDVVLETQKTLQKCSQHFKEPHHQNARVLRFPGRGSGHLGTEQNR